MNLIGLQLVVVVFAVLMVYLTYISYRKKQFSQKDFWFWALVWVLAIFAVFFPESLTRLMQSMQLGRVMDLLFIASFLLLFALVFFLYKTVRENQKKVEKVVEKVALKESKK